MNKILIMSFLLVALATGLLYVYFVMRKRKESMRGNVFSNMKKSVENKMKTLKTNQKTKNRLKGN